MGGKFIFTDTQVQEIISLYAKGYGTIEISRRISFEGNSNQVSWALKRSGVKFRPAYRGRPQHSVPLSPRSYSLIDGLMLGDGHLLSVIPPAVNSSLNFSMHTRSTEFLEWVKSILSADGVHCRIKPRWNKPTATVFSTRLTKEFTVIRNRWYPDGIKAIPNDLVLTPECISTWYMGDGSLMKGRGIAIYTNGFTFPDVLRLCDLLKEIGVNSRVREHKSSASTYGTPGTIYPVMYVPRGSGNLDRFFDFMGPCPVSCFEYKWPRQS